MSDAKEPTEEELAATKLDGEPEVEAKEPEKEAEPEVEASAKTEDAPVEKTARTSGAFAPTLEEGELPENVDQRLAEIKAEKAAGLKKMFDGDISPEDYSALEERLTEEREAINALRSKAEFTSAFNAQMQVKLVDHSRAQFLKSAQKEDGVNYADPATAAKFDRAFAVLAADPEHSSKPLSELESVFEAAHEMVKAQTGWKPAKPVAASAAATEPAKPAGKRAVPQTLSDLPAAAEASTNDETLNKMMTLEGEDLERFMAGLPKGEHQRLLRRAS